MLTPEYIKQEAHKPVYWSEEIGFDVVSFTLAMEQNYSNRVGSTINGLRKEVKQLQAQLKSEKLSHAAWEKQSLLEYSELADENQQLRDALTTIGDSRAGTSAMELQVFARNVLKAIKQGAN